MIFQASNEHKDRRRRFAAKFGPRGLTRPLDSADYVLSDRCGHTMGAELKTWDDLLASITDGRLFGSKMRKAPPQIDELLERFTHPVILAEGGYGRDNDGKMVTYTHSPESGFTPKTLSGYSFTSVIGVYTSLVSRGIWVIPTPDYEATLEWLRVQHDRSEKGCFDYRSPIHS